MGRKADESKYTEEEKGLWDRLREQEGKVFYTSRALPFSYSIVGNELRVDRKEKTITRSTVNIAFAKAKELGTVTGPKKLGVFGSSYLWPVFLELGICRKAEEHTNLYFSSNTTFYTALKGRFSLLFWPVAKVVLV